MHVLHHSAKKPKTCSHVRADFYISPKNMSNFLINEDSKVQLQYWHFHRSHNSFSTEQQERQAPLQVLATCQLLPKSRPYDAIVNAISLSREPRPHRSRRARAGHMSYSPQSNRPVPHYAAPLSTVIPQSHVPSKAISIAGFGFIRFVMPYVVYHVLVSSWHYSNRALTSPVFSAYGPIFASPDLYSTSAARPSHPQVWY